MPASQPYRGQAKSAVRALEILETVGRHADGLTFTQLKDQLDLPKSSLHELLALLADRSYLRMDSETRAFRIGIRAWELGQKYVHHTELVRVANIEMHKVVEAINETAQLAVLDGLENVYLVKVDCTHALRIQTGVGKRFPAHATGLGKALLAALPVEERSRRLTAGSLQRMTANTVVDPITLGNHLSDIAETGFAVDWEEGTDGLRCVAVLVFGASGPEAAISISVPSFRATSEKIVAAIRLLARASVDISAQLGALDLPPSTRELLDLDAEEILRHYHRLGGVVE